MTSFGVLLVILGVGSLVLPYLNLDISILDSVDQVQPWAGVIVAAVGLITVLFASRRRPAEASTTATAAAPAAAAPTTTPSAMERAGEPTTPVSTTPPANAPEARAWPTDPPERSDDD